MNAITLITWLDVWAVQSALYRQQRQFDADAAKRYGAIDQTRTFIFRGQPGLEAWAAESDDEPCEDSPLLEAKEWVSIKRLLSRFRKTLTSDRGPPEFGRVYIESLLPQSVTPWNRSDGAYCRAHHQFQCAIVTNPACQLYSGIQAAHVPAGQVVLLDTSQQHCAMNMGLSPRFHLIVDVRRPEET